MITLQNIILVLAVLGFFYLAFIVIRWVLQDGKKPQDPGQRDPHRMILSSVMDGFFWLLYALLSLL
jgi:hypothetical protein